jgi:hypothetical protein
LQWPAQHDGPTVESLRTAAVIAVTLFLAACGGDSPREPEPVKPVNREIGTGAAAEPPVAGPPDGGTRAGHGNDLAAQFERKVRGTVRVPDRDVTPPLALLRVDPGAGEPVVHDSPVRSQRRPALRLARPELIATALIRDADGGTGRVRVSAIYTTRCNGQERQHGDYFPPAQVENIRIAPGVRVPIQRERTARLRFAAGCDVTGHVFAEATNASSLESFSDPIWFRYETREPHGS